MAAPPIAMVRTRRLRRMSQVYDVATSAHHKFVRLVPDRDDSQRRAAVHDERSARGQCDRLKPLGKYRRSRGTERASIAARGQGEVMPTHQRAIWHGSKRESLELLLAVGRNCACRVLDGKTVSACAARRMLAEDQRAIDGLLFARNISTHLVKEEFTISHPMPDSVEPPVADVGD